MRARGKGPHAGHRQQGLAIVEAAIILPLLLMVMLAVGELGRLFYEYNTLNKTVRDAARYLSANAIPPGASTGVIDISTSVEATTKSLAVYGSPASGTPILRGLVTDDIVITVPDAEHVRVTANYTYTPLLIAIPTFGLGSGPIGVNTDFTVQVTMRAL